MRFFPHFIVSILSALSSYGLNAQALQVFSSAGESIKNSSGELSFTVGEMIIETWTQNHGSLSAGFHRPVISMAITGTREFTDIGIEVYPNPALDHVVVQTPGDNKLLIVVSDNLGRTMCRHLHDSDFSNISFDNMPPGMYYLIVYKNDTRIRTFKILKSK
ncbi:MAG: T9SS type A sorting domain-containing protein [Cyclobacteriaceae bacterium]